MLFLLFVLFFIFLKNTFYKLVHYGKEEKNESKDMIYLWHIFSSFHFFFSTVLQAEFSKLIHYKDQVKRFFSILLLSNNTAEKSMFQNTYNSIKIIWITTAQKIMSSFQVFFNKANKSVMIVYLFALLKKFSEENFVLCVVDMIVVSLMLISSVL